VSAWAQAPSPIEARRADRGPLVSVIVPTYRRGGALRTCLEALTRQDYERGRYEVLVVDDGGGEAADAVRATGGGRGEVTLLSSTNQGPAAARNRGAEVAAGDLLAFTDDDCVPRPSWLRCLARCCSPTSGVGAGGRTLNACPGDPRAQVAQMIVDAAYTHANTHPSGAYFFAANNLMLPTAAFAQIGGFDPSFRTSEDRDICARWREAGLRLAFAADAVVLHAHTLTTSEFWRVHFAYGRGAYRFHRARADRRGRRRLGLSFLEPRFYGRMARLPRTAASPSRAIETAALLALWQAANTAGFVAEAVGA